MNYDEGMPTPVRIVRRHGLIRSLFHMHRRNRAWKRANRADWAAVAVQREAQADYERKVAQYEADRAAWVLAYRAWERGQSPEARERAQVDAQVERDELALRRWEASR